MSECIVHAHPPTGSTPQPTHEPMFDLSTRFPHQFPQQCNRLLGVVDDMQRAGLGWTSGHWAAALIDAAQNERTLIELTSANRQSRWCWRAPGTLSGCFYEPWSRCMAPAALDRMVTRQLSSFAVGAQLLSARNQTLKTEAVQFLFGRPLAWVRDMGDCIMRRDGLASGGFVNVFVRDSEEKRREANSRRTKMGLPASHAPYVQLFEWLTNTSGAIAPSPAVAFLQTSSSSALTQIVGQGSAVHWSYSNNTRSDHDDWGGWQAAAPDLTTAVAGVNLYIGSHASHFVGLHSSSWTGLQASLMRGKLALPLLGLCCGCKQGDQWNRVRGLGRVNINVMVYGPASAEHIAAPRINGCTSAVWGDQQQRAMKSSLGAG